jgi:hypothetical protein
MSLLFASIYGVEPFKQGVKGLVVLYVLDLPEVNDASKHTARVCASYLHGVKLGGGRASEVLYELLRIVGCVKVFDDVHGFVIGLALSTGV